jgi:hypothetical protein
MLSISLLAQDELQCQEHDPPVVFLERAQQPSTVAISIPVPREEVDGAMSRGRSSLSHNPRSQ